ncbi:MAG: hypothetical protein R3260_00305 [Pseudomonas sp.]|nr:hypothetical protein [Pseudomonas sp.]
MANNDKVQCKCCGMMMVPKTIFSPGIYGGWGWRIGGGRPVSNCCPFCLSESWDGAATDVRTSTWYRAVALILSFVCLLGGFAILGFLNEQFFSGGLPGILALLPIAGSIYFAWRFTKVS